MTARIRQARMTLRADGPPAAAGDARAPEASSRPGPRAPNPSRAGYFSAKAKSSVTTTGTGLPFFDPGLKRHAFAASIARSSSP